MAHRLNMNHKAMSYDCGTARGQKFRGGISRNRVATEFQALFGMCFGIGGRARHGYVNSCVYMIQYRATCPATTVAATHLATENTSVLVLQGSSKSRSELWGALTQIWPRGPSKFDTHSFKYMIRALLFARSTNTNRIGNVKIQSQEIDLKKII